MKVLLLEDDSVSQFLWKSFIKDVFPSAKIFILPSVDQLAHDMGSLENIGDRFDLIVSDIFLAGDKTGLDLMKKQPRDVQLRTIITSSVSEEHFEQFCKEHEFSFKFIPKPLNKSVISNLLHLMREGLYHGPTPFLEWETKSKVSSKSLPLYWSHAKPETIDRPVYFITGCSSGVGLALAQKLVHQTDYRVVLTARPKSLPKLKSQFEQCHRVMILPLDITEPSHIRKAVLSVLGRWGGIDVLINNAGVCYRSATELMDSDAEEIQLKTNYLGPLTLIRKVISVMREQGRGHIINVSSVSGIMGMPTMGSYTASKHALEGLSESLWYELKPFGISVTVVRPGFINNDGYTHVASSEKAKLAEKLDGPYSKLYTFMCRFISKVMVLAPQTSDDVAESILNVAKKKNPPLWKNTTVDASFFATLRWILPEFLFYRVFSLFFRFMLVPEKPKNQFVERGESKP